MKSPLAALWKREDGQDTTEYALLLAFVAITAAALFMYGPATSLNGMWSTGSGHLSAANAFAR